MNNVHNIVTTRTPDDWAFIKHVVKERYNQDISQYVPVFLKPKDFEIQHDPTFFAADILISWWSYKKMPVVLLEDIFELETMDAPLRFALENTSVFII